MSAWVAQPGHFSTREALRVPRNRENPTLLQPVQAGGVAMDVPEPLFKYMPLETGRVVLESGRLRWSSPLLFNDILEFQRIPRFVPSLVQSLHTLPKALIELSGGSAEQIGRLTKGAKTLLQRVHVLLADGWTPREIISELAVVVDTNADEKMRHGLESFYTSDLAMARVLCVTTVPDNDAMWAHYGDQHKGVVLGFRHMRERDTPLLAARPVRYYDEPPIVGSGLDLLMYGPTRDLRMRIHESVCFAKGLNWAYEKEWRAVTWEKEGTEQYSLWSFHPVELESVCFGIASDAAGMTVLHDLVTSRYPRCRLYRMKKDAGSLRRVPCE